MVLHSSKPGFDEFNFWPLHAKNISFEALRKHVTVEVDDCIEHSYLRIIIASVLATGNTTFGIAKRPKSLRLFLLLQTTMTFSHIRSAFCH